MGPLSLKMKLALGFGAPVLILAVMGIVIYTTFQTLSGLRADAALKGRSLLIQQNLESRLYDQEAALRGFLLDGRPEEAERYAGSGRQLTKGFSDLAPMIHSDKGKQMFAHIRELADANHAAMDRALELQRAGKTREAIESMRAPQTVGTRNQLTAAILGLIKRGTELGALAVQDQEKAESKTLTLIVSLLIAGVAVSFAMAIFVARNITGQISQMVEMIQAISDNDLSCQDVQIRNRDEIGRAGSLLNSMKNNLREMVQAIAENAGHVASASEELNATSQQITANSEETSAQADLVSKSAESVS